MSSPYPIRFCRTAICFFTLWLTHLVISDECAAEPKPLVVHEWGTFTSLHDELGNAIGGINSDDEPVPDFVHRVANLLLLGPQAMAPILYQGAPRCHPDVTMRLETPVVYFHPARDAELPIEVDFQVAFRGGWLSEFYPHAEAQAPGVKGPMQFGPITPETVGSLRWRHLQIGTDAEGPETKTHVWLAPRRVQAANVMTTGGESERFLFYRGVGHVESPLRVLRDPSDRKLIVTPQLPVELQTSDTMFRVPRLWLVEVRPDGACAFREVDGVESAGDALPSRIATLPARLDEATFHPSNKKQLRSSLRACLIDDGLFADEADALLNTWELSYFKSPGLRLFYLLPRVWTDHVLPVELSVDADVVRTMVGRVEIVTPQHRQLLKNIAQGPISRPGSEEAADFRAYSDLGRFRNALVLDELQRRPTPELQRFVDAYGLHGYRPVVSR